MRDGFLGSRMWYVLERETEGACGDMNADIGIDACDRLRRDGERRGEATAACASFAEDGRLERASRVT